MDSGPGSVSIRHNIIYWEWGLIHIGSFLLPMVRRIV